MKFEGQNSKPEMLIQVHPRLAMLMFYVELWMRKRGKEAVWTSIIRVKNGDTGIHADKRAADMSVRNLSMVESEQLVEDINSNPLFTYDPVAYSKKAARLNDGASYAGQPVADHIHLQVGIWI